MCTCCFLILPWSVYGRPFERGRPCGHCLDRPVCPVPATRSQRTSNEKDKIKLTTNKRKKVRERGRDRQRLSTLFRSLVIIIVNRKKKGARCESVAPSVGVFCRCLKEKKKRKHEVIRECFYFCSSVADAAAAALWLVCYYCYYTCSTHV